MNYEAHSISELSPHLFWDVDVARLDWEGSQKYIVEKVALHGGERDWFIVRDVYGFDAMRKIILGIRDMDDKNLNFYSRIFETPLNLFRCYIHRPLQARHTPY